MSDKLKEEFKAFLMHRGLWDIYLQQTEVPESIMFDWMDSLDPEHWVSCAGIDHVYGYWTVINKSWLNKLKESVNA